jgi:hypothetical protein
LVSQQGPSFAVEVKAFQEHRHSLDQACILHKKDPFCKWFLADLEHLVHNVSTTTFQSNVASFG